MLNPLKRKYKVFNNIGFDIETDVENRNKFVMGSLFFSDNDYKVFDTRNKLIDYIRFNPNKFKNSIIWAHNTSFDFLGTFFNKKYFNDFMILQRGSDFILAQSYIYKNQFHYNLPKKTRDSKQIVKIQFYDTSSYYKAKLEFLGKIINIPKLENPKCFGRKPKNKKEYEELLKYNVRDSEICKKFADFLQFSFRNLDCQIKSTIASTTMDVFRRNYLKESLWTPNKEQLKDFSFGYYGGRTEVFNRGHINKKLNCYDFNSMYPYVMKKYEYPHPNYMHKLNRSNKHLIMNFEGIAEVEMETNGSHIPYLPVRDNKLIFPNGIIRGCYTNFEIRQAILYGYRLKKIYWGYYYTKTFTPFKEYIEKLYNMRLKYKRENNPMELPVKLLMNSLYGKFAQSIFDKSEIKHLKNISKKDYFNETTKPIGVSGFFRVKKEYKKVPSFIIPILSIYITAYARDRLYSFIKNTIDELEYIDTDSLFTKRELMTSDRLGYLKLEYKIKESIFVKPKFYGIIKTNGDVKIKIKGFQKCPQDFEKFIELLKHPKVYYKKFAKFRECLIRGFVPNEQIDVTKTFNLEDDKRLWDEKFKINDYQYSKPLIYSR